MKKSIKRIICAVFVAVFIVSNVNTAFASNIVLMDSEIIEPELFYTASNNSFDSIESYIGDIDEFQEYILECILIDNSNLTSKDSRGKIDVSKYNIPYNDIIKNELSNLIYYESPELFRIQKIGFEYYVGGNIISLTPIYNFENADDFKKEYEKFTKTTNEMVGNIKGNQSLSDVEKALLLHDRLAERCEYDTVNVRAGTVPTASHNAYGPIVLGVGVCQGYAYAYDYLLEQVGIEAEYCSSKDMNHGWNIVYIDKKPYYVDVTWDDPEWDMSGRVKHDNFLVSSNLFLESHKADDYKFIQTDTIYDNAFWKNSDTAFQLIDDKIYYIDSVAEMLLEIDDIADTTPIIRADFRGSHWYANEEMTSYWSGNYSKLASSNGFLYYSGPTGVYRYNPEDMTVIPILTQEQYLEDSKDKPNYYVYGMAANKCVVSGEYSNTPNYDGTTKKENSFEIVVHEEAKEWTVVTPATTTTKGKKVLKCTKCDEILKTEEIPVVGEHTCNWSEWETVVTATCANEGKQVSKCSICYAEEYQSLPKLEHKFTEYTIQATCNVTGLKYKECSVCGTKETLETYSATGNHKKSDWIPGAEPTCKSEGYKYKNCSVCGVELERETLPKLSHGETELVGAKPSTCSAEGYTGDTRCKDCKTITIYGETIPKNNHIDSGWITKIPATFTVDGLEYRKCTVCNTELETRTIPKKEHSSDGGKITKPATCTETGVKTYKCTKCGEVIKTEVIPTTGHTVIAVKGYAATCVKPGLTDGTKCSTCNTVIAAQKIIPATGKHVTTLVGHKPATFEADGHTGKEVCTVCTQTINQGAVIPKLTFVTPTVTVTAKNNGINVSWNAVENAQSYIIYRRVYNASTKKWSGWTKIKTGYALNSYVDSSVVLGTNYRYTVRAVNGNAMSAYTSTGTIKYDVTPTVKVANATNGIKVSWNTAVNATGYRVYRSTYSNGKWSGWKNMGTAKATATAWIDKNVKTNVSYKYTVRAVYNKVLSSYNKSGASVKFLTTPTVKIANASNGIKVSWNKITGATSYVVYSSQYNPTTNKWSSWANRGTVNATNWVDKTTQSGVTYKYTVRAANGKSLSAYVGSSGLMFLAQPTVTIANASNGIKVTWSQSAGATGYTVYSSTYDAKTKKWSAWSNRGTTKATTKSWVDTKVKSGTSYKYTVRAVNGSVKSTYVSTSGMISLAQPVFSVNKGANANVISWNKVSGATGYRVYRKANTETNWTAITTIKTTSYTDSNVNNDGVYTYTVRAYNGKVWSSYNKTGITINRNYKQSVLALVNAERAKAGLSPLEYYNNGQAAADIRANEVSKKFSHERPDGTTCFTVFEAAGISYYSAGENIALGHTTPEIVMNTWMNSQGHKANILNPNFTHMIVGYDAKTNSWVQLFLGNPYTK